MRASTRLGDLNPCVEVVLVGDAAHAMSPNMAGGAGMAVEDALVHVLVLAETIAAGRPLEESEASAHRTAPFRYVWMTLGAVALAATSSAVLRLTARSSSAPCRTAR
jgi:2-polyprenyl-6-methoxyphenol hydroxylase-like FAD-dependent oxidoreductase